MGQVQWFERDFSFQPAQNIFPSIIERLWGTPVRLEEKFRSIPAELQAARAGDGWTIKENLGHLTDLEPLWQGRLEDIRNGAAELRPTDLQNTRTTTAGHNSVETEILLQRFRQVRSETLRMLEGLSEEDIFRSALHPRLRTPMRTLDLFLFVAEHDDHHLARISELVRILSNGG